MRLWQTYGDDCVSLPCRNDFTTYGVTGPAEIANRHREAYHLDAYRHREAYHLDADSQKFITGQQHSIVNDISVDYGLVCRATRKTYCGRALWKKNKTINFKNIKVNAMRHKRILQQTMPKPYTCVKKIMFVNFCFRQLCQNGGWVCCSNERVNTTPVTAHYCIPACERCEWFN